MSGSLLWYDRFVREQKNAILEQWLQTLEEEYSSFFSRQELLQSGSVCYDLMTNLDAELSIDDPTVQFLSIKPLEKQAPLEHLMLSHTIWRETVVKQYWDFVLQSNVDIIEATSVIRKLHFRIDMIQMYICITCWEQANRRIDSQKEHIDQLRQDRLNMIGKMAASMAHEIRNPLTAIGGFLRMIQDQLSEESKNKIGKYFEIIDREMKVLLGQITGFLSFSRNNGVEESYVTCQVKDIVLSVQELIEPRLNNEGIEFELSFDTGALITIQRTALQQVLINLINNSADALQDVDYSGKIRVSSRHDEKYVYIDVEDNGPGIPEPIAHAVFSAFYTTKRNGTGIGLAICKQIVEKNAGDITYTSRTGKTVFTIVLQKELDEYGAV